MGSVSAIGIFGILSKSGLFRSRHASLASWRFWLMVGSLLLMIVEPSPAQGGAHAWSCLLYASNSVGPSELPVRLVTYGPRLRRSFGFSNYHLLAQHEIAVGDGAEMPLLSERGIHVTITSLSRASDGRYVVGLLFVEGERRIMETEARVGRESPLFIRGPEWRDGQVIIVVAIGT